MKGCKPNITFLAEKKRVLRAYYFAIYAVVKRIALFLPIFAGETIKAKGES